MKAHFAEEIERWVTGDHQGLDVKTLIAHLASCESCSREAQKQATLELDMDRVASSVTRCPDCQRINATLVCKYCGASASVEGFHIERVLVKNAHGRMYVARAPDGTHVALKELAFVQAPNLQAMDSFDREARILRTLEHPAIPRFVASFQAGEGASTRLYLAQEFIPGESLLAIMDRRAFKELEVVDVARQILDVLVYLQDLSPKVFHRDIKPANLVLRPDGTVALVDFGSARDRGATVGSTLVGTFGYMPIEQLGGIVSETSDLYALGATMFHLLTRREPWTLMDPDVRRRFKVSPALKKVIEKLIALRPADRYATAREARAALEEVRLLKVRPALFEKPWLVAAVAVVPCIAAIAGLAGLDRMRRHTEIAVVSIPTALEPASPVTPPDPVAVPPVVVAPVEEVPPHDPDELDAFIASLRDDQHRNTVANELEEEAQKARALVDREHAHVIFGQIVVDGSGRDPRQITAQMRVLEEGYFVTAVADLHEPLELRLAGQAAKSVSLQDLPPRSVIPVGVIHMTALRPDQMSTLKGQLVVKGGLPSVAAVIVGFRVRSNSPVQTGELITDDGRSQIIVQTDASGRFTLPNLVPTEYSLTISAEGYTYVERVFTLRPGVTTNLGALRIEEAKSLSLQVKTSSNADFTDQEPEEANQTSGGNQYWLGEVGSKDWLEFEQAFGVQSLNCDACEILDLGSGPIERFTKFREGGFALGRAPMVVREGHVYLVKRTSEWVLFRVEPVTQP